jgi:hypothetical protein
MAVLSCRLCSFRPSAARLAPSLTGRLAPLVLNGRHHLQALLCKAPILLASRFFIRAIRHPATNKSAVVNYGLGRTEYITDREIDRFYSWLRQNKNPDRREIFDLLFDLCTVRLDRGVNAAIAATHLRCYGRNWLNSSNNLACSIIMPISVVGDCSAEFTPGRFSRDLFSPAKLRKMVSSR